METIATITPHGPLVIFKQACAIAFGLDRFKQALGLYLSLCLDIGQGFIVGNAGFYIGQRVQRIFYRSRAVVTRHAGDLQRMDARASFLIVIVHSAYSISPGVMDSQRPWWLR